MTTPTLLCLMSVLCACIPPCGAFDLPLAEQARSKVYKKIHPGTRIAAEELVQAKQSIGKMSEHLTNLQVEPDDRQHVETQLGFCNKLNLLLDRIAQTGNIHTSLPEDDFSGLHYAVCLGLADVAEMLLKHGADPDILLEASSSRPLWYACRWDQPECIRLLLQYGADPNNINMEGRSCLFEADTSEARILIEEGKADIKRKASDGFTILHSACQGDVPTTHYQMANGICRWEFHRDQVQRDNIDPSFILYLLGKGIDINAGKGGSAGTPLHQAVQTNLPDIAELLLKHGADPNAANDYGTTPLHLAVQYDDLDIAKLLLQYHANVDAKTKNGETPADIAQSDAMKALLAKPQ